MLPDRVAIFGVGLLGGSIGLALRSLAPACRIIGYGHRASTLTSAVEIGAIDEFAQDPAVAARGADLVILCTPVGTFEGLLGKIAAALDRQTLITDVGSTKRSVVRAAESILADGARFVGSHPMAGSEKRGVEFARADLFQGARCIVTPTPHTDSAALLEIEDFWRRLGMNISRLSPEEHDRLICDISHLPHALAAALVDMQSDEAFALAGKGFLDTTRVAGGDGALWRDIFLDNADNLCSALARIRQRLDEFESRLNPQHAEQLKSWLDATAAKRAKLLAEKLRELEG